MALRRADARHYAFAYAGKHGVLAGTAYELAYVGAHRDSGFGYELYAVLGHCGHRGSVDHFGIYAHLHGLKHVASGKVYGCGHLEAQIYVGFGS